MSRARSFRVLPDPDPTPPYLPPEPQTETAAPPPRPPSCETCHHWHRASDTLGECRESPPTIHDLVTQFGPRLRHGLTPSDLTCGKHLPR